MSGRYLDWFIARADQGGIARVSALNTLFHLSIVAAVWLPTAAVCLTVQHIIDNT